MKQYFFNFVIFISKILIDGNVLCLINFFSNFFFFKENILGKIGPQRRVSHVGKQTTVPASNPEFSQQPDVKARGGKKTSKPTNKTEDEFSLDNILSVQQKLLKSSEGM